MTDHPWWVGVFSPLHCRKTPVSQIIISNKRRAFYSDSSKKLHIHKDNTSPFLSCCCHLSPGTAAAVVTLEAVVVWENQAVLTLRWEKQATWSVQEFKITQHKKMMGSRCRAVVGTCLHEQLKWWIYSEWLLGSVTCLSIISTDGVWRWLRLTPTDFSFIS